MTVYEFDVFCRRPENGEVPHELHDGRVVAVPFGTKGHGLVCGRVGSVLGDYSGRSGFGQVFLGGVGVQLTRNPDTVRGADVTVHAEIRTFEELLAEEERPGWGDAVPVLVADVVDRHDDPADVRRRTGQFLAAGVAMLWSIEPAARTVTVHTPDAEPRTLSESDELTGGDVLPGFACGVGEFFTA